MKNEEHIKKVLENLGFDMTDKNYKKTPERFVKFLESFTESLRENNYEKYFDSVFPCHNGRDNAYKGMLIQGPIRVYSTCSHHLLPAVYDVFFAYLPQENKMIGFSKIVRIIKEIAKRPMNQEDLTQEIIDVFSKNLKPKGLGVFIFGSHFCMKMRGAESDAINMTSALKGEIRNNEKTKQEFFAIINNHKMTI
jgi:GTP cyclohydrolase IA